MRMSLLSHSGFRWHSLMFLLAEASVHAVTLGFMAWALRTLSKSSSGSIDYASDPNTFGYGAALPGVVFSTVLTQVVTGYRSTSTQQPRTITERTTQTYIDLNGKTITTSPTPLTYTVSSYLYGLDATGTKLRTYSTAGFSPVNHLAMPASLPSSTPTAAPLLPYPRRARPTGTYLRAQDHWDVPASVPEYWSYNSVTVVHGFDFYFLEAGVDYFDAQEGQYKLYDADRVHALTAFVALSMIAIVGRLVIAALYFVETCKLDSGMDLIRIRRRLGWATLIVAALLLVTMLPFWAVYGSLTRRSDQVEAATASYAKYGYSSILQTSPWTAKTVALLVFWTLSTLISIMATIALLARGR